MSLRFRTWMPAAAVLLVLLSIATLLLYVLPTARSRLSEYSGDRALARAVAVASAIAESGGDDLPRELERLISAEEEEVLVVDRQGNVETQLGVPLLPSPPPEDILQRAAEGQRTNEMVGERRVAVVPLVRGGNLEGGVVFVPEGSETTLYQLFLRSGMEAAAIASIIGGGLALLLAVLLSRRVEGLIQGARSIEQGNLSYRIKTGFDDELGELGTTFNSMAAKLQDSFAHLENRVAERTAQLETERARLETVLREMPSGVVIAEAPSGEILLSNERSEQIRRRSLPRISGIEEYDEFAGFHLDGRPYEPEEWPLARSVSMGEEVAGEEIVITRGDGTHGTLRVNSSPIRDRDGRVVAGVAVFADITEQKRAEEAIRASEERYRVVAETASDAIIMIDEDSEMLFLNGAAEKIFGYTRAEMLGQRITMLMPEYLRETHLASFNRYLDTGRRHLEWDSTQLPGLHKSGKDIPLEVSFGEFVKEGKRFFTGFIRDITERKQAEKAIRESEERFRATFEQAAVGIAHTSAPEGQWLRVNRKMCDILGYAQEELLGLNLQDLTHPDDLDANLEHVRRLLSGEVETFSMEKRYLRKDGSVFWANLTASLVRELSGEPRYFIHVVEDITERKQTEEEIRQLNEELEQRVRERTAQLEQQRATLNTILDNLSEGVLAIDSQHRPVFANPTARSMLNAGEEEPLEKLPSPWKDFDLPQAVTRCTEEQECVEAQVRDGESFLQVRLEHLPGADEHKGGVLMVIRDLSEGRRLEANQQRFLANAAHELKTPITSILGSSELLLTESEDNPEIRYRFLNHIFSEALRMQRLSDTLLRLARTGVDLRDPKVEAVDLGDAARDAAERMKQLAASAGLDLRVEGRGGRVRADQEWLEQVFLVVLSNAVQHSERGDEIRVRVEGAAVTIEDEGAGISEEDLPYVFERFYRGKRSSGSFGLGLAICKDLVERMGGSISLESKEGVGTKVEIELQEVGTNG